MKFNVSSSVLLTALQNAVKVIPSKSSIPILEYFLFEIAGDKLRITSSDSEIIFRTVINIVNEDEVDFDMVLPSKRTLDSLKELSEQPLTFDVSPEWEITLLWSSGNMKLSAMAAVGYPEIKPYDTFYQISLPSELLDAGFANTIFAAEQQSNLRPVMQGVLMEIEGSRVTFVATNAQHLAKFEINIEEQIDKKASLIIPPKTVSVIRAICAKDVTQAIVQFDAKNILFKIDNTILMSRLIEGNFPRYRQVIPQSNPRHAVINRQAFLSAVKRVSVCASTASGLIMLKFSTDKLFMTCEDPSFGLYAEDTIVMQYSDEPMEVGFKVSHLLEALSIAESEDVELELADETRPGVIRPFQQPTGEDFLVVLMPVTLN